MQAESFLCLTSGAFTAAATHVQLEQGWATDAQLRLLGGHSAVLGGCGSFRGVRPTESSLHLSFPLLVHLKVG